MKKRILALALASVMTFAMSLTAFAASSPSASSNSSTSATAAPTAEPVVATAASGQAITEATLDEFVKETTLTTDVAGATIAKVEAKEAATLVSQANAVVGSTAKIATMVDIQVPAGTASATFTLNVSGLVAGQSVTVLHLKSDGTVESLEVNGVNNGSVTFTMTSYSPVAVVVNATAPKTGETVAVIMLIVMAGIAGAAAFGKKYARG